MTSRFPDKNLALRSEWSATLTCGRTLAKQLSSILDMNGNTGRRLFDRLGAPCCYGQQPVSGWGGGVAVPMAGRAQDKAEHADDKGSLHREQLVTIRTSTFLETATGRASWDDSDLWIMLSVTPLTLLRVFQTHGLGHMLCQCGVPPVPSIFRMCWIALPMVLKVLNCFSSRSCAREQVFGQR